MRRGRFLACALIALTAPLLLVQGLANARIAPGPIGWNGFWQAEIALGYLQLEQEDGALNMSVSEDGVHLARDALAKEPLATDGLFLLAAKERADGNLVAMQELLRVGAVLDKRNRNIGAMRLEQAAIAGDIEQTFAILDRLAITNPRLTGEFVKPLTLALENDDVIEQLHETLDDGPAWREAFWTSIPSSVTGIKNLYKLRGLTDAGTSAETDEMLLSGLAGAGLFEETLDFWGQMSGSEANPLAFEPGLGLQPVGWKVVNSGERTFSARGPNQFEVFVLKQTFGELARQLVRLPPGTYRLSAQVSPTSEAGDIEAKLECADNAELGSGSLPLDETVQWAVDDTCSIYWLVLNGSSWESRTSLRAQISDIDLERVN